MSYLATKLMIFSYILYIHMSLSGRIWARVGEIITAALQDENFEVDARRCRERTMLLLDYYKKQDFPSLRRLVQSLSHRDQFKISF